MMVKILRPLLVSTFLWALAPGLLAQLPDSQISFVYAGVLYQSGLTLSATERELVDTRFRSYLLEIARQERYTLTSSRDTNDILAALFSGADSSRGFQNLDRRVAAQGIIAMQLSRSGQMFQFGAGIYDPATGELLHSTVVQYADLTNLIEDGRSQMYDLFGLRAPVLGAVVQVSPLSGAQAGASQTFTLTDLAGTWRGDFDLGTVRIESDGTAVAELVGNETLRLRVRLDRNRVLIRQDEPNAPKIYLGSFSFALATQIARQARPMEWEFILSPAKDQLVGTKYTTRIYIERGVIQQVDNTYFREAVWTRIP